MGNAPSAPRPGARLQVIGAGLPRTGTTSFNEALRILLDGPVYHGGTQNTIGPEEDILGWIKILKLQPDAKTSPKAREEMLDLMRQRLDGFVATTDTPSCGFFEELMELYPDAKVIVTIRDPASWAKSMEAIANAATMWFLRIVMMPLPTMRYFVDYINAVRNFWLDTYGESEPPSPNVYHTHIKWIKDTVPPEKLVFFDVKDGWEPLCKALGKPIPDVPFPNLNDGQAIDRLAERLVKKGLLRWAVIIGGVASFAGAVWWMR